jgi:iron complex outermembrane receptor protein
MAACPTVSAPQQRAGLAYARSVGEYDSNGDNRVDSDLPGINISPDRVTAFWDSAISESVNLHLQASHAFDREFDRLGTPVARFEGYTTVDALARIALPLGQLNVGVENLLGEQYVTYYSQSTPRNDTYTAGSRARRDARLAASILIWPRM